MKSSPSQNGVAAKAARWKSSQEILWVGLIFVEVFVLVTEVPWLSRWWGTSSQGPATAELGTVRNTQGSVNVQSPWDLSWQRLHAADPIHHAQTVWTDTDSQTTIELEGGVAVTLEAQSMVQFRAKSLGLPEGQREWSVFVVRGRARAHPSKRSPIGTPGTPIQFVLESRHQSVTIDAHTERVLEAAQAAPELPVALPTPSPEPRIRPQPQPQTQTKPKSRPLPPPPPSGDGSTPEFIRKKPRSWFWDLLVPSAMAEEPSAEQATWTIRLKWARVEGADAYRIQISPQADFKDIQVDTTVVNPHYDWDFAPGMEGTSEYGARSYYRIASVVRAEPTGGADTVGAFSDPREVVFPEEVVQRVTEHRLRWQWGGQAALHTGVSSQVQFNADTGFASVRMQSLYLSQRLEAKLRYGNCPSTAGCGDGLRQLSLSANYAIAGFHKPSTTQTTVQPDVLAYTLDGVVLYHPAAFAYGVVVSRDYRWVKEGNQTVMPRGAVSFGPAAQLVRNYDWGGWDAQLALPLLGGFAGVIVRGGAAWRIPRPSLKWLSLRGELEVRAALWSEPTGGRYLAWSVWLGPQLAWATR